MGNTSQLGPSLVKNTSTNSGTTFSNVSSPSHLLALERHTTFVLLYQGETEGLSVEGKCQRSHSCWSLLCPNRSNEMGKAAGLMSKAQSALAATDPITEQPSSAVSSLGEPVSTSKTAGRTTHPLAKMQRGLSFKGIQQKHTCWRIKVREWSDPLRANSLQASDQVGSGGLQPDSNKQRASAKENPLC